MSENRYVQGYPVIGIRPTIDGQCGVPHIKKYSD